MKFETVLNWEFFYGSEKFFLGFFYEFFCLKYREISLIKNVSVPYF